MPNSRIDRLISASTKESVLSGLVDQGTEVPQTGGSSVFFLMMFLLCFPVVRLVDMYLEWKEANIYIYIYRKDT